MTVLPEPRRAVLYGGRSRLLLPLLLAALALAATAAAWYLASHSKLDDLRYRAAERLSLKSHDAVTAVDRYRYLPFLLAQDERIRQLLGGTSDAAPVDAANHYLDAANGAAGSDVLYVLDTKGTALASSNWRDKNSFIGHSYAFRPYFKDAMTDGSGRCYAQGATTGKAGYFIAQRVGTLERPEGVAVAKVDLSPLERAWAKAGERVAVTDRFGMIFLSSVDGWRFRPLFPLTAEARRQILDYRLYDPGSVDRPPLLPGPPAAGQDLYLPLDGRTMLAQIQGIDSEGWTILAADDVAPVYFTAALVAFAVLLTAALLFAVGFYLRERGRRVQADGLRSILENMSVGIAVFDRNLSLLAWNRKYGELNRYPDDLVRAGRPLAEIVRHNIARGDFGDVDPEVELQQRLAQAREPTAPQLEIRRPDGTWVEIRHSRMPDGRFIRIYGDITERKRTEAALAGYQDNLERLVEQRTAELVLANERLQMAVAQTEAEKRRVEQVSRARTTFLKAVSHDIRNPLNAILGYAGLVITNARDQLPPRQYANLVNLAAKGRELQELVDDLLDYTRADRLAVAAFRLEPLIEESLAAIALRIDPARVAIASEVAADLPELVQDERKLRRIIGNLLDNAAKFTEAGTIRVSAARRGGAIEIDVSDTGPGIAAEHIGRIFEEGEQIERGDSSPSRGIGMGLAICRGFARLMGGEIAVRSRPGEGSVFTLSFPIVHLTAKPDHEAAGAQPPPLGAAVAAVPTGRSGAGRATVLVVDDSKDNRDYLAQRLESGYRVLLAADGRRAIELTGAERPDIILMDLSLPLVDGWAATRTIKSDPALRSIPIIAVTAHVTARDRAAFAAAGGDGFLAKPVDEKALFDLLRHHLGRRGGGDR